MKEHKNEGNSHYSLRSLLEVYTDTFDTESLKQLEACEIPMILRHLRDSHQLFLNKLLPEIEQSCYQIRRKYREDFPIQFVLSNLFLGFKLKLEEHIQLEESTLFPYIDQLLEVIKVGPNYGNVKEVLNTYSVNHFLDEHDDVETALEEIRKLIVTHSSSLSHCLPFKMFLNQLKRFEKELHMHSWLEETFLMRKVDRLEEQLRQFSNDSIFNFEWINYSKRLN